jgi:serine/threonine-protein kinase
VFSTPTVVGDRLLVGSCAGVFYALAADSGSVLWRHDVAADSVHREFHGDPLVTDDLVVIGTDAQFGKPGYIYALETRTGGLRWKLEAGNGARSDVVTRGGRGYAVSLADELLAFDLTTGRLAWRFAAGGDPESFRSGSLALAGDRVVFAGKDGVVHGLEADSGAVVWTYDLRYPGTTWPVVVGGRVWVASGEGHLHALDPARGTSLLRVALPGGPYRGPMIALGDSLMLLQGPGSVTCVETDSGRVRWTASARREWSSSRPRPWGDMVLVGADDGELVALALADGRARWSHRLASAVRGIGAGGGLLFVGTYRGKVHALEAPR